HAYMDSSQGSITIPQSAWQPNNGIQISHLVKIIINFDEFNGNIPLNNGLNSYVEINGTLQMRLVFIDLMDCFQLYIMIILLLQR
ncbi:MAG: hypothetical protein ACLR9T_14555, partial [Thomasclavelia sp.]|uniref:hypothetical protein n=1 Tax=Thomasclavelia sp. TaxID=3025757 RepID=UPI00399F2664